MLSPKTAHRLSKLLPYFLMFFIAGVLYTLLERGIMGTATHYPSTGNPYDFGASVVGLIIIGSVGGLIFGLMEEFFFRNFLKRKSFLFRVLIKTFIYVGSLVAILIINSLIQTYIVEGIPVFAKENWMSTLVFVTDFVFVSIIIYAAIFVAIGLFITETLGRLGTGAVTSFFTGKYNKPVVEERIFMFLDMRSSTTIAEKLGHERYYQLLNNAYRDMTDAIINTSGTIYQYVGDEIVVTWNMAKGLRRGNCLRCFFEIQQTLESRRAKYLDRYGVAPTFKAGVHCGTVTTGEIGVIKREILFTGDVLNTTARIQSLCNEQQVDLLISGELHQKLQPEIQMNATNKGSFELRGRDQRVELFSVRMSE